MGLGLELRASGAFSRVEVLTTPPGLYLVMPDPKYRHVDTIAALETAAPGA